MGIGKGATGGRLPPWRGWLMLALVALLAGCTVASDRLTICERLIPALEPEAADLTVVARAENTHGLDTVRIDFTLTEPDGEARDGWIACRFGDGAQEGNRLALVAVATDREGPLTEMQLFWLKRWLGMVIGAARDPASLAPAEPSAESRSAIPLSHPLYLAQQLINATVLACVYGLIALGFTLVYAIIGRINFAFGELGMIGAVGTAIWMAVLVALAPGGALVAPAAVMAGVLALAAGTAAALGWAMGRTVFLPLGRVTSHAPLIAAIGLSIVLQEAVRLLHGAGDHWVAPDYGHGFTLARAGAFALTGTWKQVAILALGLGVFAGLERLMRRSAFGLNFRACADDAGAAALMGVDVGRVVLATFLLGGGLAGTAGFVMTQYYGVANFFMGFLIGFKALTAAVVGGIGSLGGAVLGGVLIAFLETFWSAYLGAAYRDVAVFAVLALVLVFRPQGLLGRAEEGLATDRKR